MIHTTQGVGGTEKRLTGLWLMLKKANYNVKIVCSNVLLNGMLQQSELDGLTNYSTDIITLPFTGKLSDSVLIKEFIDKEVKAGDRLHFLSYYPLLLKRKKGIQYLYSLTTCSLRNLNIKGRLFVLGAFARADKLDILDPLIYAFARKFFFYKKDRIFQTSNSYVDTIRYHPQHPKKNWIIFLGRFVPVKQVLRYVESIPVIHQKLIEVGIKDHVFYLLGYGALEEEIRAKLKGSDFKNVPVNVLKTDQPEAILKDSKIILSLQKGNNYPSKSLLEGLAAGNLPVVTSVGTTELIAPRHFSEYVPESFSSAEIAEAISKTLLLDDDKFIELSRLARDFVLNNYSIGKMADYYLNFYK
jgi:glycosyltransferase involved in cell wall biosynthesis